MLMAKSAENKPPFKRWERIVYFFSGSTAIRAFEEKLNLAIVLAYSFWCYPKSIQLKIRNTLFISAA